MNIEKVLATSFFTSAIRGKTYYEGPHRLLTDSKKNLGISELEVGNG
jgi:hypothetical protein